MMDWLPIVLFAVGFLVYAICIAQLQREVEYLDRCIKSVVEQTNTQLGKRKMEVEAITLLVEDAEKKNVNRYANLADRIEEVEKDEKEIRTYYVNYREPKKSFFSAGFECHDPIDDDDDLTEQISLIEGLEFNDDNE